MNRTKNTKEAVDGSNISRYDLSNRSLNRLKGDYLSFEHLIIEKLPQKFINRILRCYLAYKENENWQQFNDEMTRYLEAYSGKQKEGLTEQDRLTLTKGVISELMRFDFSESKNFKKRAIINKILSDFCELEYPLRERIYFADNFAEIQKAIENQWLLKVVVGDKEMLYKPYCFEIDDNSFSYYIAGYSKREEDDSFKIYATKLSNITRCNAKGEDRFELERDEKKEIEKRLTYNGIAYVNWETKSFKIRLTEYGYNRLYCNTIRHQRPVPVSSPKKVRINDDDEEEGYYYELEFKCSYRQIRNYFFSFGKNAIVNTEECRRLFIEDYEKALDNYKSVSANLPENEQQKTAPEK